MKAASQEGKVNFTFRVEETLRDDFIQTAKENNRTASLLLRDFMQSYLDQNAKKDGKK